MERREGRRESEKERKEKQGKRRRKKEGKKGRKERKKGKERRKKGRREEGMMAGDGRRSPAAAGVGRRRRPRLQAQVIKWGASIVHFRFLEFCKRSFGERSNSLSEEHDEERKMT